MKTTLSKSYDSMPDFVWAEVRITEKERGVMYSKKYPCSRDEVGYRVRVRMQDVNITAAPGERLHITHIAWFVDGEFVQPVTKHEKANIEYKLINGDSLLVQLREAKYPILFSYDL